MLLGNTPTAWFRGSGRDGGRGGHITRRFCRRWLAG